MQDNCPAPGNYYVIRGYTYFVNPTVTTANNFGSQDIRSTSMLCDTGQSPVSVTNNRIERISSINRTSGSGNLSISGTTWNMPNIPTNDYYHATNPVSLTADYNSLSNGWNCWNFNVRIYANFNGNPGSQFIDGTSGVCINYSPPSNGSLSVSPRCSGTNSVADVDWGSDSGGGDYLLLLGYGAHGYGGWARTYPNWDTDAVVPSGVDGAGSSLDQGRSNYWVLIRYNRTGQEIYRDFAAPNCSVTPAVSITPSCSLTNSVANISWNGDPGGGDYWVLLGYGPHGYGGWARDYPNWDTDAQLPSGVNGAGSSLDQGRSNYWVLIRYNRTGQEVYGDFAALTCSAAPTLSINPFCSGTNSVADISWNADPGASGPNSYLLILGTGAHSRSGNFASFGSGTRNAQAPGSFSGAGSSLTQGRTDYWIFLRFERTGQETWMDFTASTCVTYSADPAVCSSGVPVTTIRWTGISPYFDSGRGQWGVWVDISLEGSNMVPYSNKFVPTGSSSGSTSVPSGFGFASPPLDDVGNLYRNRDYYFRIFNGGHTPSSAPWPSFRTPNCSFLSANSTCDASGNLTAYVNWNNVNPAPVGPGGSMGVWIDISTNSNMFGYSNKFIPTNSVNGWDPNIPSGYNLPFTLQEGVTYYYRLFNGGHVPPNDDTNRWPSFAGGKCGVVLDPITSSCDSGSFEINIRWTGWPISGDGNVEIDDGRWAFYVQVYHITTSNSDPPLPFHKSYQKLYYVPGDGKNTYSDTAPNGHLFGYTEPLTFIPGERYYVRVSGAGPNATSPEFVATGCQSPYLRVYGGDVLAGAAIDRPVCTVNPGAQIRAFNRGPSQGYGAGAGTQFAAHATGAITEFTSAAMRSPLTSPAPNPPRGLSFSNNVGTYGGSFGASAPCLPDYWANATGVLPNYSVGLGGLSIPTGSRQVIYVDSSSNVNIRGNIEFSGVGTWASKSDIPAFYLIVKGSNIMIENVVSRIDGVFIALPDELGNGGKIFTCARDGGVQVEANRILEVCNSKLTINGAFVAKQVKFLRANNSVREATPYELRGSPTIAEVFNYSPENWLVTPFAPQPDDDGYDSLTTLSPIL